MIAGGHFRLALEYPIGTLENFCLERSLREATLRLETAGQWAGKTLGIWGQIKETRDGARLG